MLNDRDPWWMFGCLSVCAVWRLLLIGALIGGLSVWALLRIDRWFIWLPAVMLSVLPLYGMGY